MLSSISIRFGRHAGFWRAKFFTALIFCAMVCGGNLRAVETVSRNWRVKGDSVFSSSITSSPAVGSDGTIYFGVKILSSTPNGRVQAINPNGTVKWIFEVPTHWVESSPAVGSDGTVYVGCWDGKVYAIKPPTSGTAATEKWEVNTGAYIYSSPTIGPDGTIYIGSGDFNLHAISPAGVVLWQHSVGDWIDSSPAVAPDGSVYFGSLDNSIYGLKSDGTEKWHVTTGGNVLSSPVIGGDGTIYCGSSDAQLYAITPDGTTKWVYLTGGSVVSSPVIGANGIIYFGSNDGYFYALNPDGTLKWKSSVGASIASTACIRADGALIFGADDNGVHALAAADGTALWTYAFGTLADYVDSSPAQASDGTIYIGSNDGYLYSLKTSSAIGPIGATSPWPMFHHDGKHSGLSPVPAITTQPQSLSVQSGTPAALNVTVAGSGFAYQWYKGTTAITSAISAAYTIASPTTAASGSYSVKLTHSSGAVTSATAVLTIVPVSYLSNLSVRAAMTAGQTLIVGFVIEGGAKPILVRGAGPALNAYGLTGVSDPSLDLFNGAGTSVATNDNWDSSLTGTFTTVGAFPFAAGSKDAALLQSINGPHTAQATVTDSGAILVEGYDAGPNDGRQLTNLSARFHVGTGDNILIAGFAVAGTGNKQLLVRAVGPTLANYGVTGTLADPQFTVFDGNSAIASNDNWLSSLTSTFDALGAFQLVSASKDAALLVTVQAGKTYTVQVSGVASGTGEALVEIYAVP